MDGIHDVGGMQGFGPVGAEPEEPVFHFEWERRVWGVAMSTFVAGLNNGGEFRHSIERMQPGHYLASRYFEHWLTGIATRAVETGAASLAELEERAGGAFPLSSPEAAKIPDGAERAGRGNLDPAPRFAIGDAVRVRDIHTSGHTRCPRYVRRRAGTVARVDAAASVPDVEAHSPARVIETIYSVRFELVELWGSDAGRGAVHVDLWERYLEPV